MVYVNLGYFLSLLVFAQGKNEQDHWGDALIESLKVICDEKSGLLCQADCNAICANATNTDELSDCLSRISRSCYISAEIVVTQPADLKKLCWVTGTTERGGPGWLYQSSISRGWAELSLISFELEFHLAYFKTIPDKCYGYHEHNVGLGGDPVGCVFQYGNSDYEQTVRAHFTSLSVLRVDLAHLLDTLVDQSRTVAIKPVDTDCVFPVGSANERGRGILQRRGTYTNQRLPSAATPQFASRYLLVAIGICVLMIFAT